MTSQTLHAHGTAPDRRVRRVTFALAAALALVLATFAPAPAQAQLPGLGGGSDTIAPGSSLASDSGQCTANFIFSSGSDLFIGSAAHCTGLGAATDTDGCLAGSLPLGSEVDVEGATAPATLAYSSWLAMQEAGETDSNACAFNDFALLRLDPADHDRVSSSVPHWGGPVAVGGATSVGERVFSYGNSSLRQGLDLLKPKTGIGLGTMGGGWTHPVYTVTPGIPGDSGSAFLDGQGRAMGTVSTLALAPLALSNGVTDLSLALDYVNTHGDLGTVELVPGEAPFSPNQLPIGGLGIGGGGGGLLAGLLR